MALEEEKKIFLKVAFLCLLWYSTSSSNNIIGKTLLNKFPYPMTVTMAQLVSVAFYSGPAIKLMGVRPRKEGDIQWQYFVQLIIPLALGKFLATLFSHVSLWRVPISYAHTVKATMPLFTVTIARVLFGETQTTKVYISLIPIIVGVGIATITEISFDYFGLVSALSSTCAFALLTIFSKKVLLDTGIHHLHLLHLLGKIALIMFIPFWLYSDVYALMYDKTWVEARNPNITYCLLFIDGFLNWIQNIIAFSILNLVTPLTYAVANATKRISVITLSLIVLRNPVTTANVCGMFLAILGVLGYNKAKYEAAQERKKQLKVPLSKVMPSSPTPDLSKYFPNPLQLPMDPPANHVQMNALKK